MGQLDRYETEVDTLNKELEVIKAQEEELRKNKEAAEEKETTEKNRCDEAARVKREAEKAAVELARQKAAFAFLDANGDQRVSIEEMTKYEFKIDDNSDDQESALKIILDGDSANFEDFIEISWELISERFDKNGMLIVENEPEDDKKDE